MFDRPHHRRIATILQALDADLLLQHHCLFAGGTAIALRWGEYRVSVDIDFLVADLPGYRALRQRVDNALGFQALARPGTALAAARGVRADQYGVRGAVLTEGVAVKLEIVFEARIALDPPGAADRIAGIATATPLDLATSKLLANADRGLDDAVWQRDVIDLAMMQPARALLDAARTKAQAAYGDSIDRSLHGVVERLRRDPQRLDRCMRAMDMHTVPKALLWQRIRRLPRRA